MKKKLILALALVLLLVMPLSGCLFDDIFGTGDKKKDSITEDVSWAEKQDDGKDETEQQTQTEETEPVETEPSSTTVHIAMAGDIVAHMPINNNFYNSATNEYDFTYMYEEAAELLAPADFAIADFESTFHGDGEYSGYPCFDSPDSYADALKGAGIDLITLASNHSLDTWYDGLVRTLDVFQDRGITTIGTYRTQEERDANHGVVLKDINGITFAFINYTYGTNGIPLPEGKEFCVNVFNKDYMTTLQDFNYEAVDADLEYAKSLKPDMLVFLIHWGNEYETHSNWYQDMIADYLFSKGVDMILGGHVHVPQQMEWRNVLQEDGTMKKCYIEYCLGNFSSNQYDTYTNLTAILDIQVTKDNHTGETVIDDVTYTPFYMIRGGEWLSHYRVINIHKAMDEYKNGTSSYVTDSLYGLLQQGLSDIHRIMGEEFDVRYEPQPETQSESSEQN